MVRELSPASTAFGIRKMRCIGEDDEAVTSLGFVRDMVKSRRYVRRKFPNADWLSFTADGIYAEGRKIAGGATPLEAWRNAAWAIKLGHVRPLERSNR